MLLSAPGRIGLTRNCPSCWSTTICFRTASTEVTLLLLLYPPPYFRQKARQVTDWIRPKEANRSYCLLCGWWEHSIFWTRNGWEALDIPWNSFRRLTKVNHILLLPVLANARCQRGELSDWLEACLQWMTIHRSYRSYPCGPFQGRFTQQVEFSWACKLRRCADGWKNVIKADAHGRRLEV